MAQIAQPFYRGRNRAAPVEERQQQAQRMGLGEPDVVRGHDPHPPFLHCSQSGGVKLRPKMPLGSHAAKTIQKRRPGMPDAGSPSGFGLSGGWACWLDTHGLQQHRRAGGSSLT
jgi:hypothetical protein